MKYIIKRWETPISDGKKIFFHSSSFRQDLERHTEDLIIYIKDEETKLMCEFIFKAPGAFLFVRESLCTPKVGYDKNIGLTKLIENSDMTSLLNPDIVILTYWNHLKNKTIFSNYFIASLYSCIEVITDEPPEINQYTMEEYEKLKR